ncbi:MAG: hypothetical protein ABI726_04310 [bacterium]
MLRTGRIGLALTLTVALFAVAGCASGNGGTIPKQDAELLLQKLDAVQASIDDRDCSAAQTNISQLDGAVFVLPKAVGAETKGDLRKLVANLAQLASDKCRGPEVGASGVQGSTPSEPPITEQAPATTGVPEQTPAPDQPGGEGTGLPGSGNSGNGSSGGAGNPNQGGGNSGGVGG